MFAVGFDVQRFCSFTMKCNHVTINSGTSLTAVTGWPFEWTRTVFSVRYEIDLYII